MTSHQLQLFSDVVQHVAKFRAFRKFSKAAKESFAYDISLIAISVRTGCLVDTIAVPDSLAEGAFSSILSELRTISEHFNDVLHIFEPSGSQSFILKIPLFIQKLEALRNPSSTKSLPAFVSLPEKGDPVKLDGPPSSLVTVLEFLLEQLRTGNLPPSLILPPNLPSTTSIPLAAFLLDYPVAYVPASVDQLSFLSGVPLALYTCHIHTSGPSSLEEDGGREHVLVQFSYPEALADDVDGLLSVENVSSHLRAKFQPRIARVLPGSTLTVDWKHIALDRVAL